MTWRPTADQRPGAPVASSYTDEAELEALHRRSYRWWTVWGWWDAGSRGLKAGPVTVSYCRAPAGLLERGAPWFWAVSVLGRTVVDRYLARLQRPR